MIKLSKNPNYLFLKALYLILALAAAVVGYAQKSELLILSVVMVLVYCVVNFVIRKK